MYHSVRAIPVPSISDLCCYARISVLNATSTDEIFLPSWLQQIYFLFGRNTKDTTIAGASLHPATNDNGMRLTLFPLVIA
jgi:hypothetical protein